ncbi:MAG: SPOCS domain-containing protein [Cellulosilyticaceae bacterium]
MILKKISNVNEATVGDIITYTLTVENNDTFDYTSVLVKDLLTPELDFVDGSIVVGATPMPTDSILTGIEVGAVTAGAMIPITFKAALIGKPAGGILKNTSTGYFTYQNADGQSIIGTVDSNVNTIDVYLAQLTVTKTADKETASFNSLITYSVVVKNTGDLSAYSISFTDILPSCLTLVPGSFKVNNAVVNDVNLAQGVDLGTLTPTTEVWVSYQGMVTSTTGCEICNQATAVFDYVQPNGVTGSKTSNVATVCVEARIPFKQLMLDKYCEVPRVKPNIEDLNDEVAVDIEILNSYPIQTLSATSTSGQVLSGYKLIVHGNICISIEYTAALESQPVHSYHCSLPFGTFIILPPDYTPGQQVEVNAIIENVEADMVSCRGVSTNITLLLVARVK